MPEKIVELILIYLIFLQPMHFLYNITIYLAGLALEFLALFNKKLRYFVAGRKNVFGILSEAVSPTDKVVWIHCASLGEFEQAVPVLEEIPEIFPRHKIVVSFFSPSGYEVKKNTPLADCVVYLPLDSPANAKKFLSVLHPDYCFFIKYEFWPNYLLELKKSKTPAFLISGVFRKNQIFFKSYGGFMRKVLGSFEHIFLQEEKSGQLLEDIGFSNYTISGDTRFDRVFKQTEMDNRLDFVENFKDNKLCVVCGSTWPEDEAILLQAINATGSSVKFILAPHQIDPKKIEELRNKISKKNILYSERKNTDLSRYDVLIIDCIGLLTRIYNYADIAYVGGAMGTTGLHNILEAATFGVPVIIGKNYDKFPEARELKEKKGLFSVSDEEELLSLLQKLIADTPFRIETGWNAEAFVRSGTGATRKIKEYFSQNKTG